MHDGAGLPQSQACGLEAFESERMKLMFRVRARIDPNLLKQHLAQVKTGVPGMAYVKLDPNAEWPPELAIKLPK